MQDRDANPEGQVALTDEGRIRDPRERHFARNLALNQCIEVLWGLALAMVASGTILAVLLTRLGATAWIIMALPAVQQVATNLVQVPATRWTSRLPRKTAACIWLHCLAALWWVVGALVVYSQARRHPGLTMAALLGIAGMQCLFMGAALPVWTDMIARLFPERRRGLATGLSWVSYGTSGIAGGLLAQHVLRVVPYPASYALLMLAAGVLCIVGIQFMWGSREYLPPQAPVDRAAGSYLQLIRRRWREDRRLRRLVLARSLVEAGISVGALYAVYAIRRFDLPDSMAGAYTTVLFAAHPIGGVLFGRLGDRRGYRRVLAWAAALYLGATTLSLLAPSPLLYYGVFVLQGMAFSGVFMGSMNYLIESAPDPADCGSHLALFNGLMTPAWLAAPLIAILADRLSIPHALVAGMVLQALGLIALVCLVDDPRRPGRRIVVWPAPRRRTLPRFVG